jgi:hypothetical protein
MRDHDALATCQQRVNQWDCRAKFTQRHRMYPDPFTRSLRAKPKAFAKVVNVHGFAARAPFQIKQNQGHKDQPK